MYIALAIASYILFTFFYFHYDNTFNLNQKLKYKYSALVFVSFLWPILFPFECLKLFGQCVGKIFRILNNWSLT